MFKNAYYAIGNPQPRPDLQLSTSLPSKALDFNKFTSKRASNHVEEGQGSASTLLPLINNMDVCQYVKDNVRNRSRFMPYSSNRACLAAGNNSHPQQLQAAKTSSQAYKSYESTQQRKSNCSMPQTMFSSVDIGKNFQSSFAISIADNRCSVEEYAFKNTVISTIAPNVVFHFSRPTTTVAIKRVNCVAGGNNEGHIFSKVKEDRDTVTLQITNLDYSLDESSLRSFLMNQLKPITPVVSLVFEGNSYAKVTVPDLYFAKQVVSNLHRKKVGHKRMLVSYTRDSSLTEIKTLRCQVAGLLKDVPYNTLPIYKFRELFQSRFKTSISVLDLYKMQDICTISSANNEEKYISLHLELVNTLESSPLIEGLQHSVPYCSIHFKRGQHMGWAEQEIDPLPNVYMTISEIQKVVYPLLKIHTGDIPVATLAHCIETQLKVPIEANEGGVNLEHLVCCVQGVHIKVNNFGIKILAWLEANQEIESAESIKSFCLNYTTSERACYFKNSVADPLFQISREVIELVKMSPKSTIKFNRFIPAYHNHFGKQCRVADYGYTKLIELFDAMASVVQIMGDGENRQITLTHRTQIRRFTSDLLRILRAHGKNCLLLSQLPRVFAQTQSRNFDVTDYGVCDIEDILNELVNSNVVSLNRVHNDKDILISLIKRKQTISELEKTCVFAGEMVELLQNALQYTIPFQKFIRSYHYHFSYQCRLSDYGFLKLADLLDAINGLVEIELISDEDKRIVLSPMVARRVFAEQCEDLVRNATGSGTRCMKLNEVLTLHKVKYGYQIQPKTLGVTDMAKGFELLPYVELKKKYQTTWVICHNNDIEFRLLCYRACNHLIQWEKDDIKYSQMLESFQKNKFLSEFNAKHKDQLTDSALLAMRHAIEIYFDAGEQCIRLTSFMRFLIKIVHMLELRPSMQLYEIKNGLESGLTATFEFGFPNLYSVIVAHEELFTVKIGSTQERSLVSLNNKCELRQCSEIVQQPILSGRKQPFSKHRAQRNFNAHLSDANSVLTTHPQKYRAIADNYSNEVSFVSNYQTEKKMFTTYKEQFLNSPLPNTFDSAHRNKSISNRDYGKVSSINAPRLFLDGSLNSSGEGNTSLSARNLTNISLSTDIRQATSCEQSSKLWSRRQTIVYKLNHTESPNLDSRIKGHLNSCIILPIGSVYGQPNPNSPTIEKLPFWIDPIWSERTEKHIPDLENFQKLLSPYTISKNENLKRQFFDFDNHDRKIS
ncbi:meiosis regulator and mRNA stability factor 1 [Drosophila eugracilis]|uniref:meiosis regulator and mRNA stability factor 1 n=1 Tax=Drosophila eugracilis TaxID=29029 RepID=UPI001BD98BA2|nr:meiosis regulator and mRNA stability factor 1 [Drosophila eugracilis]